MNPRQQQQLRHLLTTQSKHAEKLQQQLHSKAILATLPYQKSPLWWQNVDTVLPNLAHDAGYIRTIFAAVVHITRLLLRVHRYDMVLLSGGERRDLFYAAIAGCLPWIKTPHIITDAHWQADSGFKFWLQRLVFRLADRLLVQVQPHSPEECYIYHLQFQIPFSKLQAIPWSVSLTGYNLQPSQDNAVILTGGGSFRDYQVFYQAVKSIDLPIEVGLPHWFSSEATVKLQKLPHVVVYHDLDRPAYYAKMAACKVFALPMPAGLTRCAGDQTLLNAMSLGKIVVATDSVASRLYLRHGENGFIVPANNAKAWRDTLLMIEAMDKQTYQTIADQAEFDAKFYFNEDKRIQETLQAALDLL